MTPEEIKALIAESLQEFRSEVNTQITEANKGLASNLTREIKKLQQPASPEKSEEGADKEALSLKALKTQITELTNKLEQKDKEAFDASKRSALSEAIASHKSLSPNALQKLLLAEYGSQIKEEGGQWYVDNSTGVKPLKDVVADFLKSEDGKLFAPASGVTGSGSTESKQPTPASPDKQKPTAAEALEQAFDINYP